MEVQMVGIVTGKEKECQAAQYNRYFGGRWEIFYLTWRVLHVFMNAN